MLATDPKSEKLLTRLLKDKSEKSSIRRISASGLQSLNPEAFEKAARRIVADEDDYDDDPRGEPVRPHARPRGGREARRPEVPQDGGELPRDGVHARRRSCTTMRSCHSAVRRRRSRRRTSTGTARRRRLAAMLPEQSPIYAGRGTNEVERLRGSRPRGLRDGRAAARGRARSCSRSWRRAATPRPSPRRRGHCEARRWFPTRRPRCSSARSGGCGAPTRSSRSRGSAPVPPGGDAVTVCAELAQTLALLGPRAAGALRRADGAHRSATARPSRLPSEPSSPRRWRPSPAPGTPAVPCCCGEADAESATPRGAVPLAPGHLSDLALEDQDGTRLSFGEAFARPSHRARLLLHALHDPGEVLAHGDAARAARPPPRGARRSTPTSRASPTTPASTTRRG